MPSWLFMQRRHDSNSMRISKLCCVWRWVLYRCVIRINEWLKVCTKDLQRWKVYYYPHCRTMYWMYGWQKLLPYSSNCMRIPLVCWYCLNYLQRNIHELGYWLTFRCQWNSLQLGKLCYCYGLCSLSCRIIFFNLYNVRQDRQRSCYINGLPNWLL